MLKYAFGVITNR